GVRSARDKAREIAENAKAGVSVALPNTRDAEKEYAWQLDWPSQTLNVDGLLNYLDRLEKRIFYGIGVPPELLEASEVGSGYSGRAIPMEGFLAGQQDNVDALVRAWRGQAGAPLVRFNFGEGAWYKLKARSLLETKRQQAAGGQGGDDGGDQDENGQGQGGGGGGWQPYRGKRGGVGWRNG